MKEIDTSLLRERFVISEKRGKQSDVIAVSNRMVVELKNMRGVTLETFIVRAQNMHCCVRMAAKILHTYRAIGPLTNRSIPFDWTEAWEDIIGPYEKQHNPDLWCVVFKDGKAIYNYGQHHSFFDVIENCDAKNEDSYDMTIAMAEDILQKSGKDVRIDYDGNVALAVHMKPSQARMGIILRGPQRTTTFTISIAPRKQDDITYSQALNISANYLEGVQLAFTTGLAEDKRRRGKIKARSNEEEQIKHNKHRLQKLTKELENFEGIYDVRYRPEKPNFAEILTETTKSAAKILPRD